MLRGTLFFLSWMLTLGLSAQVDIQKEALANYKSSLFKDAIPLYEQIVKSGHFTKENLYQLASCYYYTDQTKKAQRLLYQLLNYVSDDSSLMLLVQVLMMNGEYNKAIPIIKQLVEKKPLWVKQKMDACRFAMADDLMKEKFRVSNMAQVNSMNADFSPQMVDGQFIFASSRSVAIEKNDEVIWTHDAFNQYYVLRNGQVEPLHAFLGNNINDAPMSYAEGQDYVAITSNNFMDGIRQVPGSGLMMDIYTYRTRPSYVWNKSTEEFFPYNADIDADTPFSTGHPYLTKDGMSMYFASDRPGGFGGFDIYVSYKTVHGWSVPKNLGPEINTMGNEMCPFFTPSGRLFFSSDWHEGYGAFDVFMSKQKSYGWGRVVNLGTNVNSPKDDLYFTFDESTNVGYVTSNRIGGKGYEDIYQVKKIADYGVESKMVLQVGDKFTFGNSYFRVNSTQLRNLDNQEMRAFVAQLLDNPTIAIKINGYTDSRGSASENLKLSKERAGSLRRFLIDNGVDANRIRYQGYGETNLLNGCRNNVRCSYSRHAVNRRLEVIAYADLSPTLAVEAVSSNNYSFKNNSTTATVVKTNRPNSVLVANVRETVRKDHYAIGDKIEIANVYYEHGRSTVDHQRSEGLKELREILKEQPNVVIEIGAYTDATGSASYNMELSQKRAQSVRDYLIKSGIEASRLIAKGYGETVILNHCKEGVQCTKEEHAVNRRTEFKVINQSGFSKGDIIKVADINYELNRSQLDMDNSNGLIEIITLLQNSTISVEIRSHTDAKGSATYNLELSQKRARSVYDYLISKGIDRSRLTFKGYGEMMIMNRCKDGIRCSDEEHAMNRRTDFKITGLAVR